MFLKNSRYANLPTFEADDRSDFRGVRPRPIPATPGAIEHTIGQDDRPDRLAGEYYNSDRAWWRIVDANPEFVIAGPLIGAAGERVAGGDGIVAAAQTGDVMISDAMEGDAVLIPKRSG